MNIYLIAGPPGIGKSTNAKELIPEGIIIIDQDLAGYQYKKNGFSNYQDLASLSIREKIRALLFSKEDFALELNLGFESHYDFLRSIASFDPANRINLIMFFTDDLDLCVSRARIRYINGGHEVKEAVIFEMYNNIFNLFNKNSYLFYTVRLIDVTHNLIVEHTQQSSNLPLWLLNNNLKSYLI